MATVLTIDGEIKRTTDTGMNSTLPIEISDEVSALLPFMLPVDAADSAVIALEIGGSEYDILIIRSPKRVNVTAEYDASVDPAPVVTAMPVREYLILQTLGLTEVTIANPNDSNITVEVLVGKLAE